MNPTPHPHAIRALVENNQWSAALLMLAQLQPPLGQEWSGPNWFTLTLKKKPADRDPQNALAFYQGLNEKGLASKKHLLAALKKACFEWQEVEALWLATVLGEHVPGMKPSEQYKLLSMTYKLPGVLHALVEAGIDLNVKSKFGGTVLMDALEKGHAGEAFVRNLLTYDTVDINTPDYEGITALHIAANVRYSPHVKLLLDHGAEVDPVNDKGETPLMLCVRSMQWHEDEEGKADWQILIAHGADVLRVDNQGNTLIDQCHATLREQVGKTCADWQARKISQATPSASLSKATSRL